MKILGIESASLVASAAILDGDIIKAEYTACNGLTHSQTLLPMIDEVVRMSGVDMKELDAIAVSAGPGSFTGLRIGAATAKGLGLALDKPLIAVPTLAATAFNMNGCDGIICPIMDARRNQVYNGLYKFEDDGEFVTLVDSRALGIDELLDELAEGNIGVTGFEPADSKIYFLGDGVPVFREVIKEKLGDRAICVAANNNRQRAASLAVLGAKMFESGETVSSDDFAPIYLRKSQAEREREEM